MWRNPLKMILIDILVKSEEKVDLVKRFHSKENISRSKV